MLAFDDATGTLGAAGLAPIPQAMDLAVDLIQLGVYACGMSRAFVASFVRSRRVSIPRGFSVFGFTAREK